MSETKPTDEVEAVVVDESKLKLPEVHLENDVKVDEGEECIYKQ